MHYVSAGQVGLMTNHACAQGKFVSKRLTMGSVSCWWSRPAAADAASAAPCQGTTSPPPPPGANSAGAPTVSRLLEIKGLQGGDGMGRGVAAVDVAVEYQHAACSRVLLRGSLQRLEACTSSGLLLDIASGVV